MLSGATTCLRGPRPYVNRALRCSAVPSARASSAGALCTLAAHRAYMPRHSGCHGCQSTSQTVHPKEGHACTVCDSSARSFTHRAHPCGAQPVGPRRHKRTPRPRCGCETSEHPWSTALWAEAWWGVRVRLYESLTACWGYGGVGSRRSSWARLLQDFRLAAGVGVRTAGYPACAVCSSARRRGRNRARAGLQSRAAPEQTRRECPTDLHQAETSGQASSAQ
jgi:hypothetical protein